MAKHPQQPLERDSRRTIRFKENAIVRYMADTVGLNNLARQGFSEEDWRQLAQLIGYSIDGYCTLSYVDRAAKTKAELAEQRLLERENRKD